MFSEIKEKTVRGFAWSAIDNFANQGVLFVISILLARILSPADYGLIAMITIFLAISNCFINSGFGNALVRKVDLSDEDCSTAFFFNIIVSVLCYIVVFIISPFVAVFYDRPILTAILRWQGLTLILGACIIVQKSLINKKIDFKTTTKVSVSSNILSGIVALLMAYHGYGVWALVGMGLSQSVLQIILFWYYSSWRPRMIWSKGSFHYLWNYGSKLLASGLLDTIFNNIYPIVIGKIYSPVNLGYYTRAWGFAQLPSSNVTGIIQRVTFPVLCSFQSDDERLSLNYRRLLRMSAFIVFPLMLGLAAVANPLIHVLLTAKWAQTIIYLQIICFAMMWYPIHAINLNLLQVKGRSDLFLKLEIIKKLMAVVVILCSVPFGVIGICYGSVVSSLLSLTINTYYTGRLINIGFLKQMRDIFLILILSIVASSIVLLVVDLLDNPLMSLFAGILIGLVIYLGLSKMFKVQEMYDILDYLRKKK